MFWKKTVKRQIQPGERFRKRIHINRRSGDRRVRQLDVPVFSERDVPGKHFHVGRGPYAKMKEPRPKVLESGALVLRVEDRRSGSGRRGGIMRKIFSLIKLAYFGK